MVGFGYIVAVVVVVVFMKFIYFFFSSNVKYKRQKAKRNKRPMHLYRAINFDKCSSTCIPITYVNEIYYSILLYDIRCELRIYLRFTHN